MDLVRYIGHNQVPDHLVISNGNTVESPKYSNQPYLDKTRQMLEKKLHHKCCFRLL